MDDFDIAQSKISESAQRVVDRAIEESRRRDHAPLTNEHILLAFAQVEWDTFSQVMRDLELNPLEISDNARFRCIGDRFKDIQRRPAKSIRQRTAVETKESREAVLRKVYNMAEAILDDVDRLANAAGRIVQKRRRRQAGIELIGSAARLLVRLVLCFAVIGLGFAILGKFAVALAGTGTLLLALTKWRQKHA